MLILINIYPTNYQPTKVNIYLLNDFAHFLLFYMSKLTSNDFIMCTISTNIHLTHQKIAKTDITYFFLTSGGSQGFGLHTTSSIQCGSSSWHLAQQLTFGRYLAVACQPGWWWGVLVMQIHVWAAIRPSCGLVMICLAECVQPDASVSL